MRGRLVTSRALAGGMERSMLGVRRNRTLAAPRHKWELARLGRAQELLSSLEQIPRLGVGSEA